MNAMTCDQCGLIISENVLTAGKNICPHCGKPAKRLIQDIKTAGGCLIALFSMMLAIGGLILLCIACMAK